ncbi:MAG: hypothetical protein HQM11_00960 [SAR324 cluster bacterium]|nr:hypothetical protein [SAR324 cluster bacterium]
MADLNKIFKKLSDMGIIVDKTTEGVIIDKVSELQGMAKPTQQKPENQLYAMISSSYTKAILSILYEKWIRKLIDRFPELFRKHGCPVPLKYPNKDHLTRMLLAVYSEKKMFDALWQNLPEAVRQIFIWTIWYKRFCHQDMLAQTLKIQIWQTADRYSNEHHMYLKPEYLFFSYEVQYSYLSNRNTEKPPYIYNLYFNPELGEYLKQFLPTPDGYDLHPEAKIPECRIHENRGLILQELPVLWAYIQQGQLKLSNNGKILKASLKEFQKLMQVPEFFEEQNLNSLRTEMLTNLLACIKIKPQSDPLKLLQQVFENYQVKNTYSHLNGLLFHLKGRSTYLSHIYYEEFNLAPILVQRLLSALPQGQWVSLENLKDYANLRSVPILNVLDPYHATRYLHYISGEQSTYEHKKYIMRDNLEYTIKQPLIAGSMFLYACLGLVDIAYDFPKNDVVQERQLGYLSVFDGLRYVRLTDLGAFLTGKTSSYSAPVMAVAQTKVLLDENRLICGLDGNDPVKRLILEKMAKPIALNHFKVDHESFLKGCVTKKDVQEKIDLFHTHIEGKPPEIWKNFFKQTLARINPLTHKKDLLVFELEQDRDLIHLLATDAILKKHILKVENFHIAIERSDYNKVKKRLESLGYLLTN